MKPRPSTITQLFALTSDRHRVALTSECLATVHAACGCDSPLVALGLVVQNHGLVALHVIPQWNEAHRNSHEMAQAANRHPAICDKHQVAKLPERVEVVCEPALWHLRTPVVVAARPIVDAPDGAQAAC
eukprot:CAMPEP_0115076352 /NCGR_PEP_ID=MMETSP0227-20121206/16383_1 /TAXON_ID=89957 /ORGANISM="Polarella glacialis, Strain CCMP 1383" /LENGTH=128 /DNA_ID=CAMNT_0002463491 /DNA_START=81 /DNA_END=467 /DNA_ORIENTATION=-